MSEKTVYKSHISTRLNILFFIVFLLFSALILRLGMVQIVQGEEFGQQVSREISVSEPVEAPRGHMYDRYGNLLVGNELMLTVTYTNRNHSQEQLLDTAERLNAYITLDTENAASSFERDRREFWALNNEEEFEEKLTLEEQNAQGMDDTEAHTARIEAITEEELTSLTEEDLQVFMIWREFNSGYNDVPHKVLRGVEYEEAAQITENIEKLPGVDIIRDAARQYMYGESLKSIFGEVGSIPRESLDRYIAEGYVRNEEVGTSYLESEYESVLRGRDGSLENFTDSSGQTIRSPEQTEGARGKDLKLTFDMELQQRVNQIIEETLEERAENFEGDPRAYVVMMEPDTGEILSMAGSDNELNPFISGYEVGSSMKAASVLAGHDTGALPPGETIVDRPIRIGNHTISSVNNLGVVDDITALERSSNIYMVQVAMRIIDYTPGVSGSNWGNYARGFDVLRSYYAQLGLGVETGIDLPNEFTGVNGGIPDNPGNLLFLAFGQFDTYTPLQLAQYISTIANDGVRISPRVVSEILEPDPGGEELGTISHQFSPQILNTIDVDEEYFNRIQEGLYRVVNGDQGTARNFFQYVDEDVAGKTGTAQVFVDGESANNQTFVGYAPFEDPEVSFSVVVPGTGNSSGDGGIANIIATRSLEAYYDLKEERSGPQEPEGGPETEDPDESNEEAEEEEQE
ncbi:peptidoglycan D,D-transpeptidase FtsI family protein [Alkalicoccus halolimnae]|uniref:serine-type D-Ala-D-Ala carboxypeptidase n=1 Tax=Alkalicoccus halolimnae TaxID=1667239 RepID=A0A5C7F8P7_9BACI|nr:penicillin-binding protein 2 [Alkalicoccus halolimnae]TXF86403.1 penicillin-binding protein 2 [Alkalicoccus halolimnae]